jgi:hypothetical protein
LAPRYAHCITHISKESVIDLDFGELTAPNRIGTVAKTVPTKNSEIINGPLLGSALKMWLISGSFPYLNAFS